MFPHEPPTPEHGARGPLLHLDPETRRGVVFRLKSVQGHLGAISRMVGDEHTYCVDVLQQLRAVQGALSKVNAMVLRSHVKDHVTTAVLRGDIAHTVDELIEILKYRS